MNKKKEIVPKLRFPEFQGNGIDFVHGNKLFKSITNKNHNSDLPILAITQDQGAVPRDQIEYNVTVTDKSLSNYKVVEVGDFIISLRSFQGGIEYSRFKGICSPAYIILRKREENISELYYKYFFKTWKYIQSLNRNLEGIRDGKMISYSQFSSVKVPYPRSFKEQQKIADCLSSIDDLIDAESRKLKALEKYKKGLMQKLFPAEGKTLPEWRFPEFSDGDGWIKTSLSQICIMQAGKFINASEISDEQKNNMYPCYGGNGLRGYTLTHNCSGKYPLIGRQGALCGNVTFATGNFYATEHAIVVTANKNIDEKWLYYLLDYLQLNQYATGQAQPGLSVQTLEKVMAIYPGEGEEQKKIANCLSEIDTIIAEQSNKVEQLKAHKKGLMQGLFPSLEEADV